MSGFPSMNGMDAWIDCGRAAGLQHQLMIAMSPELYRSRAGRDFWLEFSAAGGERLGWFRFTHLASIKNQAIFVATELRPASAPAPDRSDVWLRASTPRPGGREDDR